MEGVRGLGDLQRPRKPAQRRSWLPWECSNTSTFKAIIASFVVIASSTVGFFVWYVVTKHTSAAVDDLSWRMVGVVRTLAVEQAESFFSFPIQAVSMASQANLADASSAQSFAEIAFETVNTDVVKVGLQAQGGYMAYSTLTPIGNHPVVFQVSSSLVNDTWTEITSYPFENGAVVPTPLQAEPFSTLDQEWYTSSVAAAGTPVWAITGTTVPVITYSQAQYDGATLTGVVASDLVIAKFITNVIDFLANVSPNGVIYICTVDGLPLVTSTGLGSNALVTDSLEYLRNRAGGDLNNLGAVPEDADWLGEFQKSLQGEEFYILWEPIEQDNLRMLLVMVLSRSDFREEMDKSHEYATTVVALAAVVLLIFSSLLATYLVERFVKSIRKSLDNMLQAAPSTVTDRSEDSRQASVEHLEANLGVTPMSGCVRILQALSSSLPPGERSKLNVVIHRLVHSRAEDLYTPAVVSSSGAGGSSFMGGVMSLLVSASDQQKTMDAHTAEALRIARRKSNRNLHSRLGMAQSSSSRSVALPTWGDFGNSEELLKEVEEAGESEEEEAKASEGSGRGSATPEAANPWHAVLDMDEIMTFMDDNTVVEPLTGGDMARLAALLETVDEWGFDIHEFAQHVDQPLVSMAMYLLNRAGLVVCPPDGAKDSGPGNGLVAVSWHTACAFFQAVERGYFSCIHYHTARHGADTIHGVHYFLTQLEMDHVVDFEPLDLFTVMLSAAVHDYRHLGVNNNFLVTTSHPLAVRYNDKSVLENYHVASAFQLMSKPGLDVLEHLSSNERVYVRSMAISVVLATDLALSYDVVGKFKLLFNGGEVSLNTDKDKKEAKELLCKMSMKCCDVASGTKPFDIHNVWTQLVTEEFYLQGDMEKDLGLPVVNFMDRDVCCDPAQLAKSQQGFLGFVVKPIFTAMAGAFTEGKLFLLNLTDNIERWKEEEERHTKPKSPPAPRKSVKLEPLFPSKHRVAPATAVPPLPPKVPSTSSSSTA